MATATVPAILSVNQSAAPKSNRYAKPREFFMSMLAHLVKSLKSPGLAPQLQEPSLAASNAAMAELLIKNAIDCHARGQ
jgi:hypothetical protein